MVLAVIRSRGYVVDHVNDLPTTIFDINSLHYHANTTIVSTGDLFGTFTLVAINSASTETYIQLL